MRLARVEAFLVLRLRGEEKRVEVDVFDLVEVFIRQFLSFGCLYYSVNVWKRKGEIKRTGGIALRSGGTNEPNEIVSRASP